MTASAAVSDIRDVRGRFRPGCSGNPAGKPPGTQNWSTRLKGAVDEADFHAIARKTVEKAKTGSGVDARFLISHLDPKPKVAPIELPTGGTLVERFDWIWDAMARSEITPDQALVAARVLDLERRAETEAQMEARLRAEVEAKVRAEVIAEIRDAVTAEFRATSEAVTKTDLSPEFALKPPAPARATPPAAPRVAVTPPRHCASAARRSPAEALAKAGPEFALNSPAAAG
jgi:hypothetical protein